MWEQQPTTRLTDFMKQHRVLYGRQQVAKLANHLKSFVGTETATLLALEFLFSPRSYEPLVHWCLYPTKLAIIKWLCSLETILNGTTLDCSRILFFFFGGGLLTSQAFYILCTNHHWINEFYLTTYTPTYNKGTILLCFWPTHAVVWKIFFWNIQ